MDLFSFDDEYLRRLRAGEPATVDHFVAYFSQLLRIKLRARRYSPDRIEDIQQETFTRVLKALQTENGIRQAQSLGAYVNAVCNFVIHEDERDRQKNQTPEEPEIDVPDKMLDTEKLVIRAEIMEQVHKHMQSLPEREREIIRKLFLLEMDKDEICAQMGVGRDYLRVLLHRAIEHLRKRL